MMKNIALPRPATSAIAAFLVLSTPAAFAQEAPTVTVTPPVVVPTAPAPVPQTPPTVADPVAPAPVTVPQTATPTPVIRVPVDLPQAQTTAAPQAADRAAATPPVAAARAPSRPATAASAAAAATPVAGADEAVDAASAMDIAPIAADPVVPATDAMADTSIAATDAATTGSGFPWEIVGGIAALLGIGGAGIVLARRRRSDMVVADRVTAGYTAPAVSPTGIDRDTGSTSTSAVSGPVAGATAPRATPAFAAAPHGSMGRHEAMAIAGPTADNPFLTLSKRLKRARFYDRQERLAYHAALDQTPDMSRKPVSAWEIAQRAEPAAPQQQVYRPDPAPGRPAPAFRPGYSRS